MSLLEFKTAEDNWLAETVTANDLYQKAQYDLASKYYQQALLFSELMFRNVTDAHVYDIHVISPFSVSCINMANNFWAMQELKKAGDYFFYNVWNLKIVSKQEGISEAIYFDAIKNWEKAVLALTDFYNKTNQKLEVDFWKDETYDLIKNAQKWLVQNKTGLN